MKKKILFKNSTKYSKKIYDQFSRFHNDKFSLSYDFFTLLIIVLLVYCLILGIKNSLVFLSIIFAISLILFIGYRLFNPIFSYKKEVSKKAIAKEKTFKYLFYDKYFKIKDNLNYHTIHYFRLYKVFETEDFFYLYYDKKRSFIVGKTGFTQGTPQEFSKFIKDKMWLRYSKYDKIQDKK